MGKDRLVPYLHGTIVKNRDGRLLYMKITTRETSPGRQLPTAQAYSDAFRKSLEQFGRIDHLNLIIDSRGGSYYSAAGCQDCITRMQRAGKIGSVRILIDGQCGSAATVVAFAPYNNRAVFITPSSRVYIHNPKIYQYTRTDGIWGMIERVGTSVTISTIRKLYSYRTGRKRGEIREWMDEGKHFTAQEAVDVGFCDGIMTRTDFEKGVLK